MSRAWISRNLSGLAQQVTTFTKDVISEADPEARIDERQPVLEQLELNQLRQLKMESDHRAESAELQISKIAEEYRRLLTAKDSELAALREQNAALKESLQHRVERDGATPSTDRLEAGPNENALDEPVDYQDGMLQVEVKRLQGQLARLQSENQKWRQLAEGGAESSALSAKLTEMEDQHREEIALLQLTHARAIETLRVQLAAPPHADDAATDRALPSDLCSPPATSDAPAATAPSAVDPTSSRSLPSPTSDAAFQALMAATLAQLQPLSGEDAPAGPLEQEQFKTLVGGAVASVLTRLNPETLHMDCELRLAQTGQQLGTLQSELGYLRERMTAAERDHVRQKDDLVAKVGTLQSTLEALRSRMLVDAQDAAAVEEQLAAAIDREQSQLALIQELRGQLHIADESTRVSTRSTAEETTQARAERDRALGQLEELRRHLLQRERDFTEDAMRRDGQIEYLRQQIKEARGERDAIATGLQGQLTAAATAGDGLRAAITRLTGERNTARADAAARAAECTRLQKAVDNLEGVLAAFESERDSMLAALRAEAAAAHDEGQQAAAAATAEVAVVAQRNRELEQELKELARVRGEVNVARGLQMAAQAQTQALQTQLNETNARFVAVQKAASESTIDRKLVANTFVSFCTAPSHRREDVLRLLASMLSLTEDQQIKVGLMRRGFLKALFTPPPPPPPSASNSHNGPIGEEFLNFLLHETQSTPAPSPAKAHFPDATPTGAMRPARTIVAPASAPPAAPSAIPAMTTVVRAPGTSILTSGTGALAAPAHLASLTPLSFAPVGSGPRVLEQLLNEAAGPEAGGGGGSGGGGVGAVGGADKGRA